MLFIISLYSIGSVEPWNFTAKANRVYLNWDYLLRDVSNRQYSLLRVSFLAHLKRGFA